MAWLDDHPPARSQFRRPRRADPSGVQVVHTAESTPDFVAFDGGAEAVAKFIQGRSDPGSYHDIADSDSCINLVGYDAEAFHDGTGSNPHSYGVSAATRADVWPLAPQAWRDGCIYQMAAASARYATWLRNRYGIVTPARRITRAESDARVPGFISHAERDPARRTDPGRAFPWDQFLNTFAQLIDSPTKDWFDMATQADLEAVVRRLGPWIGSVSGDPSNAVFVFDGGIRTWVSSEEALRLQKDVFGNVHTNNGKPFTPQPVEAKGFHLVNRAELEAHLGHSYEF
jgi:hypothetical protein